MCYFMENFVQEQPTRCVNEKAGNYFQNTHFSYPIYPSKSQQNAPLCFPPFKRTKHNSGTLTDLCETKSLPHAKE